MDTSIADGGGTNATPDGAAPAPYPDDVVLIVGQMQGPPPELGAVRYARDWDEPCGLVAFVPGADCTATLEHLARQGRLPVPIADLTGGAAPRADFRGYFLNETTLTDAIAATQPIRHRLHAMPPLGGEADRNRLSALMLAVSRQTPIEARWTGNRKELVGYPLLSGIENFRETLEQLSRAGLLARRFFDRVHVCDKCGSARMPVREVCVKCASAQLREESLVHHYRCAYQGPRSQFEDGQTLNCPKCNRILRHYGVDYDTPGMIQQCQSCNEVFSEANIAFICADCATAISGEGVKSLDWHHYDLTPAGEWAVTQGELPAVGLESLVSDMRGVRTPRDIAMMIEFASRVSRRYERPYSVILITFTFSDPAAAFDQLRAETMMWDIIRGLLRETDFVAALEHQLVLLLPETPPDNANAVVDRVNERLRASMEMAARIRAETVGDEKIAALIDMLRRA